MTCMVRCLVKGYIDRRPVHCLADSGQCLRAQVCLSTHAVVWAGTSSDSWSPQTTQAHSD